MTDYQTPGDALAEVRRRIDDKEKSLRAPVQDLQALYAEERAAAAKAGVAPMIQACLFCGVRPYQGARFCRQLAALLQYDAAQHPETCGGL